MTLSDSGDNFLIVLVWTCVAKNVKNKIGIKYKLRQV
jgi:hypothetical protein